MKIITASIVVTCLLTALQGCDSEEKSALSQLKQGQPAHPQQIVIPPYTKPIPLVGDEKLKPIDWSAK